MRVLLISFVVGLGVGILYGLIPSEKSGAAHRPPCWASWEW